LNQAFVFLLIFIGTVYPESIRGTLVQHIIIERLKAETLQIYLNQLQKPNKEKAFAFAKAFYNTRIGV
jgi:hypothetical protein